MGIIEDAHAREDQAVKLKCLEAALCVVGATSNPQAVLNAAVTFYGWVKFPPGPEYKTYTGHEELKVA